MIDRVRCSSQGIGGGEKWRFCSGEHGACLRKVGDGWQKKNKRKNEEEEKERTTIDKLRRSST